MKPGDENGLQSPSNRAALARPAADRNSSHFPSLAKGGLTPHQLARLEAVVGDDLQTTLSVARLASECGLSAGYFARAFRVATGTTPHRWLTDFRLSRARMLLSTGQTAIAEIALTCGFWDQAHFTRVFARAEGVTPAAWARSQHASIEAALAPRESPPFAA